jgi:hypothetical protein
MDHLARLNALTGVLLDTGKHEYGNLQVAVRQLYDFLVALASVDTNDDANKEFLMLDSGKAIGPTFAAMCLNEMLRTKRFVDGVYQAVCDTLAAHPNRPVHILYAGTGPFATLVLPLVARFSSQQLQWSLLEINPTSFACLQQLINKLGLQDYIHRFEKTDAANWALPVGERIDIFVTETMQESLKREPQVGICMNLMPQLPPEVIMIPQEIRLKAALIHPGQRIRDRVQSISNSTALQELGTIFAFNKHSIGQHAAAFTNTQGSYTFPTVAISVPEEALADRPFLYILTEITTYQNEELLIDQCSLTLPHRLADLSGKAGSTLYFHYQTGPRPKMHWELQEQS